jgi:GPI-anchor transamidase subunit U
VAPWFLALFSLFEGVLKHPIGSRIFFLAIDLLIAAVLHAVLLAAIDEEDLKIMPFTPDQIVTAYLFNPLGFASVMGMNTGLVTVLLQLTAFLAAFKGKRKLTILLAAFLAYTDVYLLALMVPLMLIVHKNRSEQVSFLLKALGLFAGLVLTSDWIIYMNWNVSSTNSFSFLDSVYLSRMRIDSFRPNSGIQWYLFTQVFPAFSNLLKVTMQMTLVSFWPASMLKFRSDPLFMTFVLVGSQSILKAYPSTSDYLLFFTLLTTQCKYFEHSRALLIALFVSAGVFLFQIQIWRYWIELPGFNANFYYIFTLIWNCSLIVILLDMVSAYNKFIIYQKNPSLKRNENIKLFQK